MYTTIAGLFALVLIFVWYLKKRNEYWKDRNVPHEEAKLLVGNMWDAISGRKHLGEIFDYHYKKFHDAKYCGIMNFGIPALLIKDPELLERIFIKDFSKFHDNGFMIDEKRDVILASSPFFAKGDTWKVTRSQLTPQFSPLKVKNMFPLMDEVKDKLITYLSENPNSRSKEGLDAKVMLRKYTYEMVASCGFGSSASCFYDDNADIVKLGEAIFHQSTSDIIISTLAIMFPIIYKIHIPQLLTTEQINRFKGFIWPILKERQEKNIRRGDFLDGIVEIKEKTKAFEYTLDHMVGHAVSFLIDGSETTSTVLQYSLYELAKNKDIQEKLRKEFEAVLHENNGQLTYDILQEIEYLEMIICETLRLYPTTLYLLKECTETTTLPPARTGEPGLKVEKGTSIAIPVLSLHKDPQYYNDPEKFIPERFSTEAIASRPKITYLGFGDGPRICLGRRFASAVIKIALFGILTNFEVYINDKTPKKLELEPFDLIYTTKGGIWLNFYPLHK